jgi:hypothetical protein
MTQTLPDLAALPAPPGAVQVGKWQETGRILALLRHAPHDISDSVLTIQGVQPQHQDMA